MSPDWRNPNYERELKRRRFRVALAFLVLATLAAAALGLLRDKAPAVVPAAARPGPDAVAPGVPGLPPEAADAAWDGEPLTGGMDEGIPEDQPAAGDLPAPGPADPPQAGESGDRFETFKERALSLYRQNDLQGAQEQAQAALALRRDEELIEMLLRLRREIQVQRDYDGARTENFTVLFDGYEHEEIKVLVLDILKEAYAGVGKALNHFPGEPVTVILYTGRDFSDVTRAPGWASGMFGRSDGKIRLPVQNAAGRERLLRRVVTHEYVHALVHALAPAAPLWLHEGLAQYLSGDRAVNAAQVIPLALLADGFPQDARAAYAAYMVSLQAVSDLIEERGMPPLRRLLDELGAGRGLEEAFAASYGRPFSRWAASWRQPGER